MVAVERIRTPDTSRIIAVAPDNLCGEEAVRIAFPIILSFWCSGVVLNTHVGVTVVLLYVRLQLRLLQEKIE